MTGDKKEIHLGFREENGKALSEINECCVLQPELSALIPDLRELLQKISNYIFIVTPASVDISGDLQDSIAESFGL